MPIDASVHLLKRRRTRIVATLGPTADDLETILALIGAGANVFRLNMSHGTHDDHRRRFELVRAAAEERGEPVAVLADLCGPKIRVGRFLGGAIELVTGSEITVTTRDVEGKDGLVPSLYEALARDVRSGDRILLDDGKLALAVLDATDLDVRCRVVHGGTLRDRKGMNLPGVEVSAPALTDKDRNDARFAIELGVDLLALSFVRCAADVVLLRQLIDKAGADTPIIAKIEKPEALHAIEEILAASDGIMVARGDLGVELPPEQVPVAQEMLVELARARARPVIVATQMLESMITSPTPTRAEVTDVASAVRSGADAVMLSAETAAGAFPVEAVQMMDRVARNVEGHLWRTGSFGSITRDDRATPPVELGVALARSTAQLSRDLMVRAITVVSRTGTSTAQVACSRPAAPVLAITDSEATCRRMSLLWGVVPLLVSSEELDDAPRTARRLASRLGLADEDDRLLLVRGFHPDPALAQPSVTVL